MDFLRTLFLEAWTRPRFDLRDASRYLKGATRRRTPNNRNKLFSADKGGTPLAVGQEPGGWGEFSGLAGARPGNDQ